MHVCAGSLFSVFVLTQTEICKTVIENKISTLNALSWQLERLRFEREMSVYITYDYYIKDESRLDDCLSSIHHGASWSSQVKFVKFDQVNVMKEQGFPETAINQIISWPSNVINAARKSDVYRILLAKKLNATYVDLDVVFLANTAKSYTRSFASITVFNRDSVVAQSSVDADHINYLSSQNVKRLGKAAKRFNLEFTNAAFCLAPEILSRIAQHQARRIVQLVTGESNLGQWSIVELGAGMLRDAMLSLGSTSPFSPGRPGQTPALLSTNWPHDFHLASIRTQIEALNHPLLHLMGFSTADHVSLERELSRSPAAASVSKSASASASTKLSLYERFVRTVVLELGASEGVSEVSSGSIANNAGVYGQIGVDPVNEQEPCSAGLFSTVDAILAGPYGDQRSDCCITARASVLKVLVAHAAQQATHLGSSLVIYVSSDQRVSRCGQCVEAMLRGWAAQSQSQSSAVSSVIDLASNDSIPPPDDPSLLDAHSNAILASAFTSGRLRVEQFASDQLLQECGIDPAAAAATLESAAMVHTLLAEALQRAVANATNNPDPPVPNAIGLEVLEGITTLCLAHRSRRAFVSLNLLLLDLDQQLQSQSQAAATTPNSSGREANTTSTSATATTTARMRSAHSLADAVRRPFLAAASRQTHNWEANAFVTGYGFCAPQRVALDAAQRLLQEQNRMRSTSQQQQQQQQRQRQRQQQKQPQQQHQQQQHQDRLLLQKRKPKQPSVVPSNDTYYDTAVDVETHESLIADALWGSWLGVANHAAWSPLDEASKVRPPQLLSLPSPHLGSLSAVLGILRAQPGAHSLALISPALLENTVREALRQVLLLNKRNKQHKMDSPPTVENSVIENKTPSAFGIERLMANPSFLMAKTIFAIRQANRNATGPKKF